MPSPTDGTPIEVLGFLDRADRPPAGWGTWRDWWCSHYAFGVPSEPALELIAAHSPDGVLELGAGNGYWAMLLRDRGLSVRALDPRPTGRRASWSRVDRGDHRDAARYPRRTLLLVWPTQDDAWADDALRRYRGETVIYAGLRRTGTKDQRCATPAFFDRLNTGWEPVESLVLPGSDPADITVYRRRATVNPGD